MASIKTENTIVNRASPNNPPKKPIMHACANESVDIVDTGGWLI